jgi:hypothetical protein
MTAAEGKHTRTAPFVFAKWPESATLASCCEMVDVKLRGC